MGGDLATSQCKRQTRRIGLLSDGSHTLQSVVCAVGTLKSIEAVASSMSSTLDLRSIARAKQTNCRCPTLKFSPYSCACEAVGSPRHPCPTASLATYCHLASIEPAQALHDLKHADLGKCGLELVVRVDAEWIELEEGMKGEGR